MAPLVLKRDLRFFEEEHLYTLDKIPIINVTSMIDEQTHIYKNVPKHIMVRAQNLGSACHVATEYYDKGFEMESLHPEVKPRFESWLKFRKDNSIKEFDLIEQMVYSEKLWFCGTLDRFWGDTVADIKTSKKPNGTEAVQLTGYAIAVEEITGKKVNNLLIVRLMDDGIPIIEEYERNDDLFRSLRMTYDFIKSLR